jgi:peptidyl-prolyl cis-trans isomerase SurA
MQVSLKWTLKLGFIVLGCVFIPASAKSLSDRILVIVNENVITEGELNKQVALQQIQQENPSLSDSELRSKVLQEMIETEAIMSRMPADQTWDSEELNAKLAEQVQAGMLPLEFAQDAFFKKSLFLKNLEFLMSTGTDLAIREEEISNAVQNLPPQLLEDLPPTKYHIEFLHIPIDTFKHQSHASRWALPKFFMLFRFYQTILSNKLTPAGIEAATQKAQTVIEKARQGMSFAAIKADHKEGAQWKLETVWKTANQMPPSYLKALISEGSEDPKGPFYGGNNIILMRLLKEAGPSLVHIRHIVLKNRVDRMQDPLKSQLNKIRESCLTGEDFEKAAEKYSEDPNTIFQGGDLGWVFPESLESTWQQSLAELKPGQISLPFQTSEGFHIVQLLARKPLTVDHPEVKRALAKIGLENKKKLEAIKEFKENSYASAYIKWVNDN